MEGTLNMYEGEVKGEYGYDPAIYACQRLYVWVRKHTLDVSHIHFNDQIVNTYYP
jgi:hypothetical protein